MIEISLNGCLFDEQFEAVNPANPHAVSETLRKAINLTEEDLSVASNAILSSESLLVFRNVFYINDFNLGKTPTDFSPVKDSSWWLASNSAIGLAAALKLNIHSYQSENDGNAFVNLVKMTKKGSERKSKKEMRGHTDAVAHPLPGECVNTKSPSPDYVILVCLRNNDTPTKFCALDSIVDSLSEEEIEELLDEQFIVHPQRTFDPNIIDTLENVAVLKEEPPPMSIRFSHSNVIIDSDSSNHQVASETLDSLKETISENMKEVILYPGDIAFVNNRTALHGRGDVGRTEANDRWFLRTYAMRKETKVVVKEGESHILLP